MLLTQLLIRVLRNWPVRCGNCVSYGLKWGEAIKLRFFYVERRRKQKQKRIVQQNSAFELARSMGQDREFQTPHDHDKFRR